MLTKESCEQRGTKIIATNEEDPCLVLRYWRQRDPHLSVELAQAIPENSFEACTFHKDSGHIN